MSAQGLEISYVPQKDGVMSPGNAKRFVHGKSNFISAGWDGFSLTASPSFSSLQGV